MTQPVSIGDYLPQQQPFDATQAPAAPLSSLAAPAPEPQAAPTALGQLGLSPADIGATGTTVTPVPGVPDFDPAMMQKKGAFLDALPKPAPAAGGAAPSPIFFHKPTDGQAGGADAALRRDGVGSNAVIPMGSGARTIAAHELNAADPKRLQQLDSDMRLNTAMANSVQQDAAARAANANAGVADAAAAGKGGIASVLDQGAQEVRSQADTTLDERKKFIDGLTQLQNEKAKDTIDPNQYQKQRGVARSVVDAIAAGLAGMGQGFLHESGPNPVLEQINRDIDRNVDAQKENFAHKQGHVNDAINTYKLAFEATGSHEQAMAAARGQELQKAQTVAEQMTAQANNPAEKAKGDVIIADLQKQQVQNNIQADEKGIAEHPYVQSQTVGTADPDLARVRQLRDEAAREGHELDPQEARRQAYLERTQRNVAPGAALAPIAAQPKDGGAKKSDADQLQQQQDDFERLAHGAVGSSNRLGPLPIAAPAWQGSAAYHNVEAQEKYNAQVIKRVKANNGLKKLEDVKEVGNPYLIRPDDKPEIIKERIRNALRDLHPVAVKGGGGDTTPEGE